MKRKPSTEATAAWIRLMRVQSRVLDAVEQDLKKAGYPLGRRCPCHRVRSVETPRVRNFHGA